MHFADANVSRRHADLLTVINTYRMLATGLTVLVHGPINLRDRIHIAPPIAVLCQREGPRKTCRKNDNQIYEGPPNLICEFESERDATDWNKQLALYESCGVQEVIVWKWEVANPVWYQLQASSFVDVTPEDDRVVQSRALPGFLIDYAKLSKRDWRGMIEDVKDSVENTDVFAALNSSYQ